MSAADRIEAVVRDLEHYHDDGEDEDIEHADCAPCEARADLRAIAADVRKDEADVAQWNTRANPPRSREEEDWLWMMLDKLPVYDPSWAAEVSEKWIETFVRIKQRAAALRTLLARTKDAGVDVEAIRKRIGTKEWKERIDQKIQETLDSERMTGEDMQTRVTDSGTKDAGGG